MSLSPKAPYAELARLDAETEQEFLRLAMHAAIGKYRETIKLSINLHGPSVTRDIRSRHRFLEIQMLRKALVRHRRSPRLLLWPESLRKIGEPGFHA